jgi:site-specific DNA-cytosine methylase
VITERTFTAFFAFGGSGLAALGFQRARVELPRLGFAARFEIIGGVDIDPDACRDFEMLTGVRQHCADVATMTVVELRHAAGGRAPRVWVITAPCVAASGLLSNARAAEPYYEDLNQLALRFVRLGLEAWADAPPDLVLFENVPNLRHRAPKMVAELKRIFRGEGFLLDEDVHNYGRISNGPQNRERWMLAARHKRRVPDWLRRPVNHPMRSVGDVFGPLPMPSDPTAGAMHELPGIAVKTWVRLALIKAGGDWRHLPERVMLPPALAGAFDASRPLPKRPAFENIYRVVDWATPSPTVIGVTQLGSGALSVADPRVEKAFRCCYGIVPWSGASGTVTGEAAASTGAFAVADPRVSGKPHPHTYGVAAWGHTARTVTGNSEVGTGEFSVADPRLTCAPRATSGVEGVIPWGEPAGTVTAAACHDNGRFSVADPRWPGVPFIIAADGTWHRPMTTLELAVLQGLPARWNGAPLVLSGSGHTAWRKHIGNGIPVGAAQAIGGRVLLNLLNASLGRGDVLSASPIWVSPERSAVLQ